MAEDKLVEVYVAIRNSCRCRIRKSVKGNRLRWVQQVRVVVFLDYSVTAALRFTSIILWGSCFFFLVQCFEEIVRVNITCNRSFIDRKTSCSTGSIIR